MADTQGAYLEVIADLKRRRDAMDELIAELEALVGGESTAQESANMPYHGMRVVDAAKAVLRENGAPMSPAAITGQIRAGGCDVSSANTVASILHRYAKDNDDVFSPERGLWGIQSLADQAEPEETAYVGVVPELAVQLHPLTETGDTFRDSLKSLMVTGDTFRDSLKSLTETRDTFGDSLKSLTVTGDAFRDSLKSLTETRDTLGALEQTTLPNSLADNRVPNPWKR